MICYEHAPFSDDILLRATEPYDVILWQALCRGYDGPAAYCRDIVRKFIGALLVSSEQNPDDKRALFDKEFPPLCPPNMDRLECFERFIAFMVRFHRKIDGGLKRNALAGADWTSAFLKRDSPWISAIRDDGRQSAWRLCPFGWSKHDCSNQNIRFALAMDGRVSGKERRSQLERFNLRKKKAAEVTSLCPAGVDPVTCFEGYFAYYINRGPDMKMIGRSSSNFVAGIGSQTVSTGTGSKNTDVILCKLDHSC